MITWPPKNGENAMANMNNMIQGLYDMAKSDSQIDPVTGVPKMDEQKLRRALEGNAKLGARNRDMFEKGEPKFKTCPRYDPCPICDKCRAKASHLYKSCETCRIPICSHTYEDRAKMIKRKNFNIIVTEEIMEAIGYDHRNGFTIAFKKKYGDPPASYRRKSKK